MTTDRETRPQSQPATSAESPPPGAPAADDRDLDTLLAGSIAGFGMIVRSLAPALEKVTIPQYRVLVLVATRGPLRGSDLAVELGLLPSGITRIVNRLIKQGLASKHVAEHSHREVMVEASPSGAALVHDVLERRRTEFRGVLASMTPADRRALVQASGALASAFPGEPELDARLLLH